MSRAFVLTLAAFSFGCTTSGDAMMALDADVGAALQAGDQLAVQRALCDFVGKAGDCISDDGPVPPPPPEGASSGYFWAVLVPTDEDSTISGYSLSGTFRTGDGIKIGGFRGVWLAPPESTEGHVMGDSATIDPTWVGVFGGECAPDSEGALEGTFEGGWSRALYSEFGELNGYWVIDGEGLGGRMTGTFDFAVEATETEPEDEDEMTEGPLEDPEDGLPM